MGMIMMIGMVIAYTKKRMQAINSMALSLMGWAVPSLRTPQKIKMKPDVIAGIIPIGIDGERPYFWCFAMLIFSPADQGPTGITNVPSLTWMSSLMGMIPLQLQDIIFRKKLKAQAQNVEIILPCEKDLWFTRWWTKYILILCIILDFWNPICLTFIVFCHDYLQLHQYIPYLQTLIYMHEKAKDPSPKVSQRGFHIQQSTTWFWNIPIMDSTVHVA